MSLLLLIVNLGISQIYPNSGIFEYILPHNYSANMQRKGASLVAQLAKNLPAMQETPVQFLGGEDLLEKGSATHSNILGFPWWLSWLRICLHCGRPEFDPWVGKIPWRRERLPTPVFWPGEFHGLYSPWDCKESDITEWLSLSAFLMEKEMATNSIILAWEIPWTEPPGRLQSMGLQRSDMTEQLTHT